ncbi:MAG TPA: YigZ family protein [Clostridiales bacterium]|jgi:uncharacterized YigZ family protein|nr:YigZ family protein [Clostridiales bacterium]
MRANEYLTVWGEHSASFVERKSEFIGRIAHVETEEEAKAFIAAVSKEHASATHNVYCYILRENNTIRFSDAGEPSGTAGRPALEVLLREGVTDVCLVVTRYFGGILLGAGGLVRAYAKSAKVALDAAGIYRMEESLQLAFLAEYSDWARLEPALVAGGAEIAEVAFGAAVEGTILCPPEKAANIQAILSDQSAGRAVYVEQGSILRPVKIEQGENG